jgi:integrase
MPIDERAAADLWLKKETGKYTSPEDWVFSQFPQPRQSSPLARYGAGKGDSACGAESRNSQEDWMAHISPHLLNTSDRKRRDVKVVQELMRHASSRFTLEFYSQACLIAKERLSDVWSRLRF